VPDRALQVSVITAVCLVACAPQVLEPDSRIICNSCDAWNRPQEPFRIYGNTYYVGVAGLSSVLIDSGDGFILLDGGLPQSAELIAENIRRLGFDPRDIRIIGISHAHFDHAGGIAALQRFSGAQVFASHAAVRALHAGAMLEDAPQFGNDSSGGTSWAWQSCDVDRCLNVVYVDSLTPVSAPGYRFADGLGETLRKSLNRIAALDCDIMLSTHDFSFGLHEKLELGIAAFVDDQACLNLANKSLVRLDRRLQDE